MKTSYVLVDFENVQPGNMDIAESGFKIKVFVGAKQKIPVDVARAVQAFGSDAEYIQVEGNGKNALDFHIAYYIGRLAAESTDLQFYIVSKDTGFEPLIQHLKRQKISCQRVASVAHIQPTGQESSKKPAATSTKKESIRKTPAPPPKKTPGTESITDKIAAVIVRLSKGPRPRTEKTLRSFIKATFAGRPGSEQVDDILKELQERKAVVITKGEILYGPAL